MSNRTAHSTLIFVLVLCMSIVLFAPGCETRRQTGAAVGAGVGALAGQAVGRSTTATLIGAGVGAAAGYVIGDRTDRRAARDYDYNQPTPLTNTRWQMVNLNMRRQSPPVYETYYVDFRPNGEMVSTINHPDGTQTLVEERYRTVGNTLVIHREDYIINANYRLTNDTLVIEVLDDFRAELKRI